MPTDPEAAATRTTLAAAYGRETASLHRRLECVPGESLPPSAASAFPEGALDDSWRMLGRSLPWSCTDEEAMLLGYLIRANGLRRGFEVATAFGFSGLNMGLALRDNGGQLTSLDCYVEEEDESLYYDTEKMAAACEAVRQRIASGEPEPSGLAFARSAAADLGLSETVTFAVGLSPRDIASALAKPGDNPPELDLVFIDGGHFGDQPLRDFVGIAPYLSSEKCAVFFHDNNSDCIGHAVAEAERRLQTRAIRLPTRWNLTLVQRGLDTATLTHLQRLVRRGGGMALSQEEPPPHVRARKFPRGVTVGDVDTGQISVVVQGPIVGKPGDPRERRLTQQCLDSVRRWLPSAEIILSTWKDSDTTGLRFDTLVESDDPGGVCFHRPRPDGGETLNNINRQIVSTRAGLMAAGGKYALKLRSDFVLEGKGFLRYFGRWRRRARDWRLTQERVLAGTVYSRNPRGDLPFAFHPGDWYFFGLRDDVLGIFNIPLAPEPEMSRWFETRPRPVPDTFGDVLNRYAPEQYLWLSFLHKHSETAFDLAHQWETSPEIIALSEQTIANNLTLLTPQQWQINANKPPLSLGDRISVYTHGDWLRLYKKYCAPTALIGPDWPRGINKLRRHLARNAPRAPRLNAAWLHLRKLLQERPRMEPTAQQPVKDTIDTIPGGASTPAPRIGVVVQGPLQTDLNGHSTREVIDALNQSRFRKQLYVVLAVWEDEPPHLIDTLAFGVDQVVRCQKPERPGSCHRNFQAQGVSQGLQALQKEGIRFALKTRSDLILSERFLQKAVDRASQPDYNRLLVTNLFTRMEPFHISDILVFSSTENLLAWFAPVAVYYEDAFSPEVQFARVFIRSRGLPYRLTLDNYFRFLQGWVDLVDFYDEGLFWFKDGGGSLRSHNRVNLMMYDRDGGPVLTRLITARFYRSLMKRKYGLNLLATWLLIADALTRYIVTTTPRPLRRLLYPLYWYNLDNKSTEQGKPIPPAIRTVPSRESAESGTAAQETTDHADPLDDLTSAATAERHSGSRTLA